MERVEQYRQWVKQWLLDYSKTHKPAHGEIEVETIFDLERDHYQVVYLGWEHDQWIHACPIHIDIKKGKIWLQWNATERDIAAELVSLGVRKEDIVVGFHPPLMRQFTDYAVG